MVDWSLAIARPFMDGAMYLLGLFIVITAVGLYCLGRSPYQHSAARMLHLVGLLFIVLSASGNLMTIIWLFSTAPLFWFSSSGLENGGRLFLVYSILGFNLILTESLQRDSPKLYHYDCDRLWVIGDSLSMGADPPGKNWPELLAEDLNLPVTNRSFGGAKVDSALSNARDIGDGRVFVLLEIGGNDLLGWDLNFEDKLRRLLQETCKPGRRVAMLELPLPPFHNHFGIAQRRLAEEFDVILIPKRVLASVLATPGATTDGLHLSNTGHWQLANALQELFDYRSPHAQAQGGASGR